MHLPHRYRVLRLMKITVPPDIQQRLLQALTKAGDRECGGVLMGEHVGHNHFAVCNITIQDTGSLAFFLRELRGAVSALRTFFISTKNDYVRFNYLGEWHSHPLFSPMPSSTDHDSMRQIITDRDVGANFVVLLIFRLSDHGTLEGSAHTYLPDGSVLPSELEIKDTE